jgi:hypothetical protein
MFIGELQKFEQSQVSTLGVDHTSLDKRDASYQIQSNDLPGKVEAARSHDSDHSSQQTLLTTPQHA